MSFLGFSHLNTKISHGFHISFCNQDTKLQAVESLESLVYFLRDPGKARQLN